MPNQTNATGTLLRYGLTSDPFPLQASPATGDLDTATLTIVASNPNPDPDRHPITLQYLSIVIPTGQDPTDLTADDKLDSEAPADWNPPDKIPSSGTIKYVFHPMAGGGQVKGAGLNFILKNIPLNRQTGTVAIEVIEGSTGDPTQQFSITKFPNGWGEVSFSLNPTEVPYQGTTTLQWDGPDSADYSIEYWRDGENVTLPLDPAHPLGPRGVYPGQTDPPLSLDQTTVFTLHVTDTISGLPYQTQQQLIATVQIPAPQIISFGASPAGFSGPETLVTVSWQTADVSELNIIDIDTITGAEVVQGSRQVTRGASQLFQAQGFGVAGYTGPPAAAHACFGQLVSSGPFVMNAQPSTSKTTTVWQLVIDGNRHIFDVNLDAACSGPDDWLTYRIWLALAPGVEVADFGTAGPNVGIEDLTNASYSGSLPETDIYTFGSYYQPTDPASAGEDYVSYPLPGGATWGVQFADGNKVLVWFEGLQESNWQPPTVGFVWFEF